MPESNDPDPVEPAERIAGGGEVAKNAWGRTLDELDSMAAKLQEEGWKTVAVPAGDTAPNPPGVGDPDRFGLVYVVPDNYAEAFADAIDTGEFPVYEVFRRTVENRVFLVTHLRDPDTRTAILVAGQYETRLAGELAAAARERGVMYTHVQTLDGSRLGTFEHDDPAKFFPERVLATAGDDADT